MDVWLRRAAWFLWGVAVPAVLMWVAIGYTRFWHCGY